MTSGWSREDRSDFAVEKILAAAEKAFGEIGVSAAGMAEIADYAGCSRGTLYRYFRNRHELHIAYVSRTSAAIARRVQQEVGSIEDPATRLTEYILRTVAAVRDNPATAAWFESGVSEIAARMSRTREIVETFTTSFVPQTTGVGATGTRSAVRDRWLVRIVVSLLTDPCDTDREEREMVERFVVPAVLGDDVR